MSNQTDTSFRETSPQGNQNYGHMEASKERCSSKGATGLPRQESATRSLLAKLNEMAISETSNLDSSRQVKPELKSDRRIAESTTRRYYSARSVDIADTEASHTSSLTGKQVRIVSQNSIGSDSSVVHKGAFRRPIYPNFPFSPLTSPCTSPYFSRRRKLKESQRVSIEKIGDQLQLNQYKLKEAIGEGSYGIVKLAYSEEDEQHYAMKILSKKKLLQKAGVFGRLAPPRSYANSSIENPLTKVYREIALLKKMDHPNVVKLVEVLDDPMEDHLYLVFELLERGEILSVPTPNPLPEYRAWKYFRDVVLGIEYLHFQKIIHRDIKPSNLLLGDDDRIKIADFGVCNEFNAENDAMLTSTSGTPAFIAPEALAMPSGRYSGKAADIWQLGVTLYALIFGVVPFNDNNILKLYSKIQFENLSFPKSPVISTLLEDLLILMLEKEPQRRISLPNIKNHKWTTRCSELELPSEEENCRTYVEVTDDEIINCARPIPKLDTIILVKTMLKNHSFQHPFRKNPHSLKYRLSLNFRSHSAPSTCDYYDDGNTPSDSTSTNSALRETFEDTQPGNKPATKP